MKYIDLKNNDENMRKFNTFYYVYRKIIVDNTNGINITSDDIVQEIFLSPDECYNYLITQIPELTHVLFEYEYKTDFISKINYLSEKLDIINNYFPDNIIFKYDCFEKDSSDTAGKDFYKKLIIKTNEYKSVQIDANVKTLIDTDSKINNVDLYGIYIVPLNFDFNKNNNNK